METNCLPVSGASPKTGCIECPPPWLHRVCEDAAIRDHGIVVVRVRVGKGTGNRVPRDCPCPNFMARASG